MGVDGNVFSLLFRQNTDLINLVLNKYSAGTLPFTEVFRAGGGETFPSVLLYSNTRVIDFICDKLK